MILELENISYTHGRTEILSHVNLKVKKGECISIIGASGSGKSTLLKLCADLLTPTEGKIFYRDRAYSEYEPMELRKEIGYCIQLPYLFGETVQDNLHFPFQIRGERVVDDRVNELMDIFQLHSSYLEKSVHSLSGGEKQRIALIRSLVIPPQVLLLDEVTASLDQVNSNIVEQYMTKLNCLGTTILWVTHNQKQSEGIFGRRLTMEEGRISREEWLK